MALPPFVYSPFTRRWNELDHTDLDALRTASEGWHVEYKRDVPQALVAGKSISSFANMFGGWLFYGIAAPSSASVVPSSFPGIAKTEIPKLLDMLQKGATNVSPPPFYEPKLIEGPDPTTGLPADRVIVVVRVPPGALTPYVHHDGRIYRRVADASDPKPETDRHVLDLLWERSTAARSRWRRLIEQEFEVAEHEKACPRLHLFLSCDPYGDRGAWFDPEFDDFVREMRGKVLPFDNFYSGSGHFIARQIASNNPANLVLTWRQRLDGAAIVTVPLNDYVLDTDARVFQTLGSYNHIGALQAACSSVKLEQGRVLDLSLLAHMLSAILHRYRALLAMYKIEFKIHAKVRVESVWRTIPFVDLPEFAEFVKQHGPPVVQERDVKAPPGDGMLTFENPQLDADAQIDDDQTLFLATASALGLWIDPNAVLNDWKGLLGRAVGRVAPP